MKAALHQNIESTPRATLLFCQCLTFLRYGWPFAIRTDNEAMFTSRLWLRFMQAMDVQLLRGPPRQPWRNGRIERLVGTLKALWSSELQTSSVRSCIATTRSGRTRRWVPHATDGLARLDIRRPPS